VSCRRFDRVRKHMLESARAGARGGTPRRGLLRRSALGCFLALATLSWGCQGKAPSVPRAVEPRVPDQEARDFTLTESSDGRKNWTLWSSYAAMYNDRNLIDARTVRIEFFDAQGVKYSTLFADQGLVDQRTNNLEAKGKVRIVTESGIRMETDSLRWLNNKRKIVSDAFVRIERKHDVVTGYGFESDPSLDHFHLAREVQAEVRDAGQGDGAGL
jgi:lipopolysaccharide export system protein LptC